MDISINVNTIKNYNLCQYLVRTEKSSPSTWASTTSILHVMERSQIQGKSWERTLMASSMIKRCRIKHTRRGEIFTIISLLSKILLLQCFTIAQYISPQWEVKVRIKVFPDIWKAKHQFIHYLMGKTPNF